jgi:hypothetical protein
MSRGALGIKNPLPVTRFRRGCVSTRAAWPYIHTARLGAGRRIHCSAPHCKGYCHTDRPTRKPWGFTPTTNPYIWRAGALLSRGHLALSGFPSAGARWGESVVVAGRDGAGWQSPGPPGDPQRSSARRSRRRARARP